MTIIYLRNGYAYRVADTLTLTQVNDALDGNANRFVEVPLHPDGAMIPGTPGQDEDIRNLFITPDSVSHFVVI